jgi:alpha/beta superfamily hydrolase
MQRLTGYGQKVSSIKNFNSRLEVALYAPPGRIRVIVVLYHLLPLLGNNMDDPVLYSNAEHFEGTDKVVARLNFRGAGGSSGSSGRVLAWEPPPLIPVISPRLAI